MPPLQPPAFGAQFFAWIQATSVAAASSLFSHGHELPTGVTASRQPEFNVVVVLGTLVALVGLLFMCLATLASLRNCHLGASRYSTGRPLSAKPDHPHGPVADYRRCACGQAREESIGLWIAEHDILPLKAHESLDACSAEPEEGREAEVDDDEEPLVIV